jgi:hypothetical protein
MKVVNSDQAVLMVTRRGLGVIVGFFMTLFATSAFVVVGSFLSVSEAPLNSIEPPVVAAAMP